MARHDIFWETDLHLVLLFPLEKQALKMEFVIIFKLHCLKVLNFEFGSGKSLNLCISQE
jgi:hypothetical protein